MTDDEAVIDTDAVRRFYRDTMAREWGIRVDERMKALGVKEAGLARMTSTTPQTIHKIRTGQIVAREYLRVAIAFALAAEPGDLFPPATRERVAKAVA